MKITSEVILYKNLNPDGSFSDGRGAVVTEPIIRWNWSSEDDPYVTITSGRMPDGTMTVVRLGAESKVALRDLLSTLMNESYGEIIYSGATQRTQGGH